MSFEHVDDPAERAFLDLWTGAVGRGWKGGPLPAPQLVAFRCQAHGHYLGSIYSTPAGRLFVSSGRFDPTDAQQVLPGKRWTVREQVQKTWAPEARLVGRAGDPVTVACRCGGPWKISLDALAWALDLPAARTPLVVGVSRRELSSSGATLSIPE